MTRLALLSVHDKTGLVAFARGLAALGYELVASGGTAKALAEAGLSARTVEDLTGFPELLHGRVKTLHPAVHAGILSRRSEGDSAELEAQGITAIDLVTVSLYPFEQALARGAAEPDLLAEIDIGGVALLRAAAKNFEHVTVVPGPEHYDAVLAALAGQQDLAPLRRRLAGVAFARTAAYDQAIGDWFLPGERLRYGENPHQTGTFRPRAGAAPYTQHAGKALSYNNLLDLDAAWSAVADQPAERCAAVVLKHGSPSGIACASSAADAITRAIAGDPVSAFGGIVAINRTLDLRAAEALGDLFLEVVAAPSVSDDALGLLKKTKKNCRVLTLALALGIDPHPRVRSALGGRLIQSPDLLAPEPETWRAVTRCTPDAPALELLSFAWLAVKHVKSNAIVLAQRDGIALGTVGIGGGQTNRVDAVRQACERAGDRARGAVLASDAFFPFPDGLEVAAAAGVVAVAQPGGALRDAEVIAAADRLGLALMMTGRRHFRH